MTTAVEQAADALRNSNILLTALTGPDDTIAVAAINGNSEALARLDAERAAVPPDRERLARQLSYEAGVMEMGGTGTAWARLMREAAARIAELEAERDSVAIRFGDMAAELARVVTERDTLANHLARMQETHSALLRAVRTLSDPSGE